MATYYLDTSVLVKHYRTERGSDVTRQLLTTPSPDDRFYVSFLSVLELTSGIHRLVKGGQVSELVAAELLARFRKDLLDTFLVWPLSEEIIRSAIPIVERYKLRAGDSLHLATALVIAPLSDPRPFALVSSDHELFQAALAAQLGPINPEEPGAMLTLARLKQERP